MKQLSLFGTGSQQGQPAPLRAAAYFGFPLQYHTEDNDTIVYSVQDWIAGVAQTAQARVMWKQLKARAVSGKETIEFPCISRPYTATNGRVYQMDFASERTLYLIVQRLGANTGIKTAMLEYLADCGVLVSELMSDPETAMLKIDNVRKSSIAKTITDPEHRAIREMSVETRKAFTQAAKQANSDVNIGELTNDVYQGVLGMKAADLRKVLRLGANGNPRNHMSKLALIYTMAAEEASRHELLNKFEDDDIVPLPVIRGLVKRISDATGFQADHMAQLIGIDLLTGTKLLK